MTEITYYITCGGRYIMRDTTGKYTLTTNINEADKFDNMKIANNVYKSCLSKKLQGCCKVTPIENKNNTKSEAALKVISENIDFNSDAVFDRIINSVNVINEISEDCTNYVDTLSAELSKYDRQVVDIEHYIELNKLNACDGYKAFKMLQDALIERRKIKNKLRVLIAIKAFISGSNSLSGVQETIQEVNSQKYTPRELKDLFGEK